MTKEQLRIEGAKAALTGILSNNCLIGYTGVLADVVDDAVGYGVLFAEKLWAIHEEEYGQRTTGPPKPGEDYAGEGCLISLGEARRVALDLQEQVDAYLRKEREEASGHCLNGSPGAPDHP